MAESSEDENDSVGRDGDYTADVIQAKGDTPTAEAKPDVVPAEKDHTNESSTPASAFEPTLTSTARKEGGKFMGC